MSTGDGIMAINEDSKVYIDPKSFSYTWKMKQSEEMWSLGIRPSDINQRVLSFTSTRIFPKFDLNARFIVDFEVDGEQNIGTCDTLIHFPPRPKVDIICFEPDHYVECDESSFSLSFDGK